MKLSLQNPDKGGHGAIIDDNQLLSAICNPQLDLSSLEILIVKLATKVNSAEVLSSGGAKLEIDAKDGGKPETIETDIVLVSTGRAPVTEGLGLENVGVKVNEVELTQLS